MCHQITIYFECGHVKYLPYSCQWIDSESCMSERQMPHDNPVIGLCSECSPPYTTYQPSYDISHYFNLGCEYSTPDPPSPASQASTLINEPKPGNLDSPIEEGKPEYEGDTMMPSVETEDVDGDGLVSRRDIQGRSKGRGRGRGRGKKKAMGPSGTEKVAREPNSEAPRGRGRNKKATSALRERTPRTSSNLDNLNSIQGDSRVSKKRRRRPPPWLR